MSSFGALAAVLGLLRREADASVRRRLAAALALVVCAGLLSALSPLALKTLVDAVGDDMGSGPHAVTSAAIAPGVAYLLALCAGRLLAEWRPLVCGGAEQRLYACLRQRFFAHLLDLQLAVHLRHRSGALLHSIQQATTGCQLVITHVVNSVVPVLVEVAAVTVALAHLGQPALVATFACTSLAYLLIFWLGALQMKERSHAICDASQDAHALLADSLINCEAIKCFGAEPAMRGRYALLTGRLESHWSQLYRQRMRFGIAVTVTFAASVAASLALAIHGVAQGKLSVGGLVLANVYMLQMVRPLELLGGAARDIAQALEYLRPLLDVLDEPTEAANVKVAKTAIDRSGPSLCAIHGTALPPSRAPAIHFCNVHFGYDGSRPVLEGVDLEVPAGGVLAIVGASGSGKSSMARLLLRLYEPRVGRILLDGVPIDALAARELRSAIGVVPQDTVLFNDTIAGNIAIGSPDAGPREIEQAARLAHLHDFVTSLPCGYDTPVGERGLRLSGGERQRVAIARAVLKRPRIFVFDEATSMLDSETEGHILRDLQSICHGCTTITIAHRLSTVRHVDDIVVLEGGRISERGRHAELLSRGGTYARLWNVQMHGAAA